MLWYNHGGRGGRGVEGLRDLHIYNMLKGNILCFFSCKYIIMYMFKYFQYVHVLSKYTTRYVLHLKMLHIDTYELMINKKVHYSNMLEDALETIFM